MLLPELLLRQVQVLVEAMLDFLQPLLGLLDLQQLPTHVLPSSMHHACVSWQQGEPVLL